MMRKLFSILILLFLSTAVIAEGAGNKEVTRLRKDKLQLSFDDLFSLFSANPNAVLIDSRGPKAYGAGHFPKAVNIPGWELDLHLSQLPGKQTTLAIYCDGSGCSMSYYLADKLKAMGYQRVAVYDGGVRDWVKKKHLPLVTAAMEKQPKIKKPELELLVEAGAPTVFDTRLPHRYLFGTLGAAKNLPFNDVGGNPELLPENKDTLIVVFGTNKIDPAPYAAAKALLDAGYTKVRVFAPGIAGYKSAN